MIQSMPGIKIAENDDQARWDAFVLSRDDAGPYHLYAWKCAVETAYHHRAYYLIAKGYKDEILGVLPLFLIKPPVFRGTLVSLPFCDYGGILALNRDVAEHLCRCAINLALSLNANLELRYACPDPFLRESCRLGVISHKVRMILNLPSGSEILWNGFKSKLRSQIKKPIKDGLEFKMGSQDLLNDFYTVFRINMHNLGSPVHSKAWVISVLNSFGSSSHVGVVTCKGKPVAAGIILTHKHLVAIPWASSLIEYSRSSPNMLLYWGFLKFASDNGYKIFDLGRSTPGEGTYRFKEQWGAMPAPLYWYGDDFSELVKPALTAGKIRYIIEQSWTRLPQSLVDVLGPFVRRYITL